MKLTVLDLFCGAGGFSEGFRQAGYQIIMGVDSWKPATQTFEANFKNSQGILKDIGIFSDNEIETLIPDTDILIGSPPCQLFSTSNKLGKANKENGITLLKVFLKIVVIKRHQGQMQAWFMENVPNFTKSLKANYSYSELGLYDWAKKNKLQPRSNAIKLTEDKINILSSVNFSVAQNRNRAFVGEIIKTGKFPKLIQPNRKIKTLNCLFSRFPKPQEKISYKSITDFNYPNLSIKQNELTDHFYDSGLYEMQWNSCRLKKINHAYMGKVQFPEDFNKPSRTVTTQTGYSRESLIYKDETGRVGDGEYREPTIREIASIMSFPISYQFSGSENQKRKLVGNAVCPLLSYNIALSTLKYIDNRKKIPSIKFSIPSHSFINLNTYQKKLFNRQPVRKHNSKFRRCIFKKDGIGINLSNFNIVKSEVVKGKWYFSLLLGYKTDNSVCLNEYRFKKIQNKILKGSTALSFLKDFIVFLEAQDLDAKTLQSLYERKSAHNQFLCPDKIFEQLENIILKNFNRDEYIDCSDLPFLSKKKVLRVQLYAIYCLSIIEKIINTNSKQKTLNIFQDINSWNSQSTPIRFFNKAS